METDAITSLVQEVAAEVVTPRFRALGSDEVWEKGPGDLVTQADAEAEVLLTRALGAAYPDALILGEEAYSADDGLADAYTRAEHAFTIDPVDGTKNFVNGSPDHAVMVGERRSAWWCAPGSGTRSTTGCSWPSAAPAPSPTASASRPRRRPGHRTPGGAAPRAAAGSGGHCRRCAPSSCRG